MWTLAGLWQTRMYTFLCFWSLSYWKQRHGLKTSEETKTRTNRNITKVKHHITSSQIRCQTVAGKEARINPTCHMRRLRRRERHVIARIKCQHYFHYIQPRTIAKQQWVQTGSTKGNTLTVNVIHKAFYNSQHNAFPKQWWVTARRVARRGIGVNCISNSESSTKHVHVNQVLMCMPRKCVSANQRNCLK